MDHRIVLSARRARALRIARRDGRQMCKCCGRVQDEVDFIVSARTWAAVVPARWDGLAVCMACFDRFASDRGLHTVKVFLVNGP